MKKLLIVLAVLAAAIVAAGIIVPKTFEIEREITINRPAPVVFASIRSVKNNQKWNPWLKLDPKAVVTYAGVDGTVGSSSSWSGNDKVGAGTQEITEIVEGQKVVSELRFEKPFKSTAKTWLAVEAANSDQARVKWGFAGESKFPFNLLCVVMNGKAQMAKTFDEGLADLKTLLEKKK